MILALPYDGLRGTGYALIVAPSRIVRNGGEFAGTIESAHYRTPNSVGAIFTGQALGERTDLNGVVDTARWRVRMTGLRSGALPHERSWTSLAARIGPFGLARVDVHPIPTLYGIEATVREQRVIRYRIGTGAVFTDEARTLVEPAWEPLVCAQATVTGRALDDDAVLEAATSQRLFGDPMAFVLYATDAGTAIDRPGNRVQGDPSDSQSS